MAVLSERDAQAWGDLAARIAAPLNLALRPGVLADRNGTGLAGARLGRAIHRARSLATRLAGTSALVVRTDVTDFYPSVDSAVLHRVVAEAGADPEDARLAADMLEAWGAHGYAGIPVGPAASIVLGNTVLRPVDEALRPFRLLRWVDDYLIGVGSGREAQEVLDRVDASLDTLGLKRHPRKTRVGPGIGGWLRTWSVTGRG
jgi:hypothetical protein